MAHTTIATIFRESRGSVLLLMALVLLAAVVMTVTGLQSVDAKETTLSVSVTEASAPTATTSIGGQIQCGPGPWLPQPEFALCDDWYYWTELVASGWDGEQQWAHYCLFMLLCTRTSTLRCWTETW